MISENGSKEEGEKHKILQRAEGGEKKPGNTAVLVEADKKEKRK